MLLFLQNRAFLMMVTKKIDGHLLSIVTLSVEHFHATTHIKHSMSMLQYATEFMTVAKESVKRSCEWSAYYFTSRKGRLYPTAENA